MKKLQLIALGILFTGLLAAQEPPPPPNGGEAPSGNNTPVGGGSPIDGGLAIFLALGAGYTIRKLYHNKKERT